MINELTIRDLLHRATHGVPGVPAHVEHPAGHQGRARRGGAGQRGAADHRAQGQRLNHSAARPPRVLVAWQRRIAAFFGQEV